jgi:hypothetical protein
LQASPCGLALSVYLLVCGSIALGAIFISYRRSDSAGESGRLSDDLVARFGSDSVFMDVDAIQPGRDFRKAIRENVGGCNVLLAVIGAEWLETKSSGGRRRLDNESDYVRLEIATALARDIPVVPVLVHGARMPKADQLPEDIRELAYRNSVELTHARWKSDVQVLCQALSPYLVRETAPATAIPEQVQQPLSEAAPVPQHSPSTSSVPSVLTAFDSVDIARVGRELANYIGPIAEVVVKRAAKRCASLPDLCNLVSQEIDSNTDRTRFLASCRH